MRRDAAHRILFVEPSAVLRRRLENLAQSHGWDAVGCEDIPAAEQAVQSATFDLVVTAGRLLDAVRRIAMEVPLGGVDVVEVSPPYDNAEITAYLGNRTVLEALGGIAWRAKALRGEVTRMPSDPLLKGR